MSANNTVSPQAEAAQQEPKGMAGRAADPASLLTVYLRYDRLADAADLVLTHFAAYQKVSSCSRDIRNRQDNPCLLC